MWGWNSHGQLGLPTDCGLFVSVPTKLCVFKSYFSNEQVIFKKTSLGSRHSILLDIENNVWSFGWNKYQQLIQDDSDENQDLEINEINIEEPTKVTKYSHQIKDIKCAFWFTLTAFE